MTQKTYLTIAVGPKAKTAKPVLCTDDPNVVKAAIRAIIERCGVKGLPELREFTDPAVRLEELRARVTERQRDEAQREAEMIRGEGRGSTPGGCEGE